jgi:hypothetical protein
MLRRCGTEAADGGTMTLKVRRHAQYAIALRSS